MRTPTYSSSAGRIHVRRPSARHLSLEGLFQPKLCHDDLLAEMPFFPSPLPCSCLCTSCWYVSLLFSSSSCRPIPKISPCRITTMRSASRTVERRWAMMITVRSAMVRSIACWTNGLPAAEARSASPRKTYQQENLRVAQQCPCDGDPLLLPSAQMHALLPNERVELVGELLNEGQAIRHARDFPQLLFRNELLRDGRSPVSPPRPPRHFVHDAIRGQVRRLRSVEDVFADRAPKELRLLRDDPDVLSHIPAVQLGDGDVINPERPFRNVVEPLDQSEHGRLSAAALPHQRDGLARVHGQRKVS
eukprot:scaffold149_cov315-Pinguiococcus_pyrenoidosus.AAC.158